MKLRELSKNETGLLQIFLYEAIYNPEGVEPPDRSIIEQPELKIYFEDFGTGRADHCIVADDNGRVIGAGWTRIMNDYAVRMYEKVGFKTVDENAARYAGIPFIWASYGVGKAKSPDKVIGSIKELKIGI